MKAEAISSTGAITPVLIREARSADDVALAHRLFVEYAEWLNVDLCFQGFADELRTLPGAYAPPDGRLLLAFASGDAIGCIALRPLDGDPPARIGEVKRLYVRPAYRHGGCGRLLVETLIAQAREIGYRELKLDSLEGMASARKLYVKYGFAECPPYCANPLPGVVYMSRTL